MCCAKKTGCTALTIPDADEYPIIEYQYEGRFDFEDFCRKVTPLAERCIRFPMSMDGLADGDFVALAEDDIDYTPELRDMFERIGISALHDKHNFRFEADMTYIMAVVDIGFKKDLFPVDVLGTISIIPSV